MKLTIASLFVAATLVSATAVSAEPIQADYVPQAKAGNVVIVTEYLTVTAGARPPASSTKPTAAKPNANESTTTAVKTVAPSGQNEAAGNGAATPASQPPAADSKAADTPATPAAAASVPAMASSAPAPAASRPAENAQVPSPAQATPAASAATQPTSGNSSGGDTFTGDGTYFSPGLGSCGLTNSDSDLIAAIPAPQYGTNPNPNNAEVCGKCALVKGPKGQVKVKITDRCPVCKSGDLDLSPSAFEKIGDFVAGRIPISWSFVAC
ncbi:hypothetical protein GGI00_000327 [Coemansia sp. RSA 2681]|nr:hypothetical protein GGI00_000327 [Coemansia sp. RSA 2681]